MLVRVVRKLSVILFTAQISFWVEWREHPCGISLGRGYTRNSEHWDYEGEEYKTAEDVGARSIPLNTFILFLELMPLRGFFIFWLCHLINKIKIIFMSFLNFLINPKIKSFLYVA